MRWRILLSSVARYHPFRHIAVFAVAVIVTMAPVAADAGPFGAWAGIVVAGDNRAASGAPAEVFDNARRSLARTLVDIGFDPANVRHFSTQPGRYAEMALRSDFNQITQMLRELTRTARAGCLLYFTSHGSPDGIVLGDRLLSPHATRALVDEFCPDRPTVIVVSACYSGVFIPALADANRMILTAARPDRASFGCSEDLHYTFFDQCVLQSVPLSPTFPVLAAQTQACVAAREQTEGVSPPSEPQLFVGSRIAPLLEFYTLDGG